MLVYGDHERVEAPAAKLARVRRVLARAAGSTGIVRHGHLVDALIEAGELVQGLADCTFAARGAVDGPTPDADAAMALAVALARRVDASWRSGFAQAGLAAPAQVAFETLAARTLPEAVRVRTPEGFAHYALYPEAYALAARDVPAGPVVVIGIRSIGTTLAAMAAAARGAPAPPTTLRPVGHPFGRCVATAAPAPAPGVRVLVADEGPGLSGSSFAAVGAHLAAHGVPPGRIHFLPSHGGAPGPQADAATRAVWARTARHVRTFDDLALGGASGPHRLEAWVADLVGEARAPLAEISGGRWRDLRAWPEGTYPPVLGWQERRKFLIETERGPWLIRFAGLGRIGRLRCARAQALAEAGFAPRPVGWRHGFLVERWHAQATMPQAGPDRDRLAAYLAFRARSFPASPAAGATAEALFAMARHNAAAALGEGCAARLDAWRPRLPRLEARRRPVETDNRLHPWEWIAVEGRVLKTDALDHHAGHDLVGAQDVAWDVAGAQVELGLDAAATEALAARIAREGGPAIDPELLAFCRACYLAFQLGAYAMAAASAGEGAERTRLDRQRAGYAAHLAANLDPS